MAIEMIIAITPTAKYMIMSVVVARFVWGVVVGAFVGAASPTLR